MSKRKYRNTVGKPDDRGFIELPEKRLQRLVDEGKIVGRVQGELVILSFFPGLDFCTTNLVRNIGASYLVIETELQDLFDRGILRQEKSSDGRTFFTPLLENWDSAPQRDVLQPWRKQ